MHLYRTTINYFTIEGGDDILLYSVCYIKKSFSRNIRFKTPILTTQNYGTFASKHPYLRPVNRMVLHRKLRGFIFKVGDIGKLMVYHRCRHTRV